MTLFRQTLKSRPHPIKLDIALKEGKKAAQQGLSIGMCPYRGYKQLAERENWINGYESVKNNREVN